MVEGILNKTQETEEKLAATARRYAGFLREDRLSEEEIDDAIEELRPVRMWFYAARYGDAPGYRAYGKPSQGIGNR